MKSKFFKEEELGAVELIFENSNVSHSRCRKSVGSDDREHVLLDLVLHYFESEADTIKQLFKLCQVPEEKFVLPKHIKMWRDDLARMDTIKQFTSSEQVSLLEKYTAEILEKIKACKSFMLIPTGLIKVGREQGSEHNHVSCAVLETVDNTFKLTQIDPGSEYHPQKIRVDHYETYPYMVIDKIPRKNFTNEFVKTLVTLKCIVPSYKYSVEIFYELLFAQLNGQVSFETEVKTSWVRFTENSPAHTWEVISLVIDYINKLTVGKNAETFSVKLVVEFKLHLAKRILRGYNSAKAAKSTHLDHFEYVLLEICQALADDVLKTTGAHKDDRQYASRSREIITLIKKSIHQRQVQANLVREKENRGIIPTYKSLAFPVPDQLKSPALENDQIVKAMIPPRKVYPKFEGKVDDVVRNFNYNYVSRVPRYGIEASLAQKAMLEIETLIFDYLIPKGILASEGCSVKDGDQASRFFKNFLEKYIDCSRTLERSTDEVNGYHDPEQFNKRLLVSFFFYAAMISVARHDKIFGPHLKDYTFSTDVGFGLSLKSILEHLVVTDKKWLRLARLLLNFFEQDKRDYSSYYGGNILFSQEAKDKYGNSYSIAFKLTNDSNYTDAAVALCLKAINSYPGYAHKKLYDRWLERKEVRGAEKAYKHYAHLAYSSSYMPEIYKCLRDIAYNAKRALLNLSEYRSTNVTDYNRNHYSEVSVFIGDIAENGNLFFSYHVKSDRYQRFVSAARVSTWLNKTRFTENEIIASLDRMPEHFTREKYMYCGFLRSNVNLIFPRLYTLLSKNILSLELENDCILVKQALFEVAAFKMVDGQRVSLLEWSIKKNRVVFIALVKQISREFENLFHKSSSHKTMLHILDMLLGLYSYCETKEQGIIEASLSKAREVLKTWIQEKSTNTHPSAEDALSMVIFNAYLIYSYRRRKILSHEDLIALLNARFLISRQAVNNIKLNAPISAKVASTMFVLEPLIASALSEHTYILNRLIHTINPDWANDKRVWTLSDKSHMYCCEDYVIDPYSGSVFFRNEPVMALNQIIYGHKDYKLYFGDEVFAVIPDKKVMQKGKEVKCYISVDRKPQIRLAIAQDKTKKGVYQLLIEERKDGVFHEYVPQYYFNNVLPEVLIAGFTHWRYKNKILIKNSKKNIVYEFDINAGLVKEVKAQHFVIPYKSFWMNRIETADHLMLKSAASDSSNNNIVVDRIRLDKLDLSFFCKNDIAFSNEFAGYQVSACQSLNTIVGFSQYIILEKPRLFGKESEKIVVVPFRKKVNSRSSYHQYDLSVAYDVNEPKYFSYYYHEGLELLKGDTVAAELYLALIYLLTASNHRDVGTSKNSYEAVVEILNRCWQNSPYSSTEVDILGMILSAVDNNWHPNSLGIWLLVYHLILDSMSVDFLFESEVERSHLKLARDLLGRQEEKVFKVFSLYRQYHSKVFLKCRLTKKQEMNVLKHAFSLSKSKEKKQGREKQLLREYYGFLVKGSVGVFDHAGFRNSMSFYKKVFSSSAYEGLNFSKTLSVLNEKMKGEQVDFHLSPLMSGWMDERMRSSYFLSLYDEALTTKDLEHYKYKLFYLCLRASPTKEEFEINMFIARVLYLVASHQKHFSVRDKSNLKIGNVYDLSDTCVTFEEVSKIFNAYGEHFSGGWYDRHKKAEEMSKRVWASLKEHGDLDSEGWVKAPPWKLASGRASDLQSWYKLPGFSKGSEIMRKVCTLLYKKASNQFFQSFLNDVMKRCDQLLAGGFIASKVDDCVGSVNKVTRESNIQFMTMRHFFDSEYSLDYVKFYSKQALIDLGAYFVCVDKKREMFDFPVVMPEGVKVEGYGSKFISLQEKSWKQYLDAKEKVYAFKSEESVDELEAKLKESCHAAKKNYLQSWAVVSAMFDAIAVSEKGHLFYLKQAAYRVPLPSKVDILKMLLYADVVIQFNPFLKDKMHAIREKLICHLRSASLMGQINRILSLLIQYKASKNLVSKKLIVNAIVKNIKEKNDEPVYRNINWLLFSFEHNIILRDNQKKLTIEMMNQSKNVMYQLNMGEGKSSVILPLLGHQLGVDERVVRIVVLEPLFTFMRNLLTNRFGVLLNRRIYALPFSRSVDVSVENLEKVKAVLENCKLNNGVLMVTPVQRLSLNLRMLETFLDYLSMSNKNTFEWNSYRQRTVYDKSELDSDKNDMDGKNDLLKKALVKLNYISEDDVILKYPDGYAGRADFREAVSPLLNISKVQAIRLIDDAYYHLRKNSIKHYVDLKERFELLQEIYAYKSIDILDESDEILRHGTELNYTIGRKYPLDGQHYRWLVPQWIFRIVFFDKDMLKLYQNTQEKGVFKCNQKWMGGAGVPYLQLLDKNFYEKEVKSRFIEKFFLIDEVQRYLGKYHFNKLTCLVNGNKGTLIDFISGKLSAKEERLITSELKNYYPIQEIMILAKGWFSHGILSHVLNYRFRINYGLSGAPQTLIRKGVAVPYKGKDVPSLRSDFSHPDIMIGFTILSYLYGGLHHEHIRAALIHLKKSVDINIADRYLSKWLKKSEQWIVSQLGEVPEWLSSFKRIDLKNDASIKKIAFCLRYNFDLIAYYLNNFVFPEETNQFIKKITADAHTLAGEGQMIGFSGTDDRKITMPQGVKAKRLHLQKATDGKMLHIMCREKNSSYFYVEYDTPQKLLKKFVEYAIKNEDTSAIIDAGGLIINMSNHDVAKFLYTHLKNRVSGVIYFDDLTGAIMVLEHRDVSVPIKSCHLPLNKLFGYLDEVHTRGADIKLQLSAHGILTISDGMQKDKLMQAAMRLRQLDDGQSLSLWSSKAVGVKVAQFSHISLSELSTRHFIAWTSFNTIAKINKDLYAVSIRKLKWLFKQQALELQKKIKSPVDSFINKIMDDVNTALIHFYSITPVTLNQFDHLEYVVAQQIKLFWVNVNKALSSGVGSDITEQFNGATKKLFRATSRKIKDQVEAYLDSINMPVQDSFDQDEEKEVEMEIVEEQVVVLPPGQKPEQHVTWSYEYVFEEKFISRAQKGKYGYPTIIKLRDALSHVSAIPGIQNIKWHNGIYTTQNFHSAILSQSYFDKTGIYSRPVDYVILFRFSLKTEYLLISGREAHKLYSYFIDNNQNKRVLVPIDQMNDKKMFLPPNIELTQAERRALLSVKLYNGSCIYMDHEEGKLRELLGFVSHESFISKENEIDVTVANKILQSLKRNRYLNYKGGYTAKLGSVLSDHSSQEKVVLKLEHDLMNHVPFVLKVLHQCSQKSIVGQAGCMSTLHHSIWNVVNARGRVKKFTGSSLEKIIGAVSEDLSSYKT